MDLVPFHVVSDEIKQKSRLASIRRACDHDDIFGKGSVPFLNAKRPLEVNGLHSYVTEIDLRRRRFQPYGTPPAYHHVSLRGLPEPCDGDRH